MNFSSSVKESPVEFSQKFLTNADGTSVQLHSGQQELVHGIQPTTVIAAGRQWGKSFVLAIYILWFMCTHANRQIYIIAPTVDQSRIIFNEVAFFIRNSPILKKLIKRITEYPFPHITLVNGTEVHGRGANSPQFIRGKKAHLIIVDEAAYVKDKVLTDVIEPMLTVTIREKDSALLLISTPFGTGAFYDFYERAATEPQAKQFHFTSLDNPHADKTRLERIKQRYGEESLVWQTEYMARFVDGDLAVLPWSHIKRAYEQYPHQDQYGNIHFPVSYAQGHKYVQGTDLANVRDWFVTSILDITNPQQNVLVNLERAQKKGYAYYKSTVRNLWSSYNTPRTLIDATSLGASVVEDLRDIGAEGFTFTNSSKYDLVQELVRMFAENKIAIPYDRTIVDELRNFSYFYTPAKNLKMEAKEGHDDIFISLALCAKLSNIPSDIGFFGGIDFENFAQAQSFQSATKREEIQNKIQKIRTEYRDPFKELFSE